MAARLLAVLLVALAACSARAPAGSESGTHGSSSGSSSGSDGSSCTPTVAVFDRLVWRPVLAFKCAICHASTGVAAGTRLVFETAAAPGAGDRNLAAAAAMAGALEEGEPLLIRRATGTTHTGGRVIQPGDADYQRLADFVGRVRGDAGTCRAAATPACLSGDPGPRALRRLSRNEYDNTLRDLLGVTKSYASTLVPDITVHGFDNNAQVLVVTPLLAEQLRNAAEEVGETVAARPENACAGDGAACARTFLLDRGARLLRRPVGASDETRWLAVYRAGAANPSSGQAAHASGLAAMIAGILQSPTFLYRSELGARDAATGRYLLDDYEIASELSYLLWGAPPDDALWDAAKAGTLRDPATIAAQAGRLLASTRARGSIDRFTFQWLTSEGIAIAKKDAAVYPELTDAIRTSMAEELGRLAATYTLDGSTLGALFTAPETWVDARLAGYYGIAAPASTDASGFGKVTGRGGLLASGAVLTVHGQPNSSSPISRGKLVREQILCQVLPIPPSGVVAQPPALDPSSTTRERYREHSSNPACYSCHVLVDGIGFGFERFDGIGRSRTTENGKPVDDSGEVKATAFTNATFQGAGGLATVLSTSPEVRDCFALQWVRWGYGLSEGTRSSCLVEDVQAQFKAKGTVIKELLLALTQASHFRARVPDVASSSGGGGSGSSSGGSSSGGSSGGGGGSSSGSSSGSGSSGGSSGGSPDTPGVTVSVNRTNTWASGYCATVSVTNGSGQTVTWRVTVDVLGTIYNHWNSDVVQSGTRATFTGASWNASLAPGASAEAGFCANL